MNDTLGTFEGKSLNANQMQGSFYCSCGASLGGQHTVAKGSTRTWTCSKCKKRVTARIPK
jgi:hypothetical protein